MPRVLILSKNSLAEQKLQCRLQRSISEVFCSSELLQKAETYSLVIQYFSVVIFSDTISTIEMATYLPYFKKMGLSILRKGQKEDLKSSEFGYLTELIDDWIDEQTPLNILIEQIVNLAIETKKNSESNFYHLDWIQESLKRRDQVITHFSNNERKLLYHLYAAKGIVVSRMELCHLIWEDNATNSHLSQLSTLVAHIREKLINLDLEESWIKTFWGRGYILSSEFIDYLSQSNLFQEEFVPD